MSSELPPEAEGSLGVIIAQSLLNGIDNYLRHGPPSMLPGQTRVAVFVMYESAVEQTGLLGAINYENSGAMFAPDPTALMAVINDAQALIDQAAEQNGLERLQSDFGEPRQG